MSNLQCRLSNKIMHWKGLLVIAVVALVAIALASRIKPIGRLLFPGGAPTSS